MTWLKFIFWRGLLNPSEKIRRVTTHWWDLNLLSGMPRLQSSIIFKVILHRIPISIQSFDLIAENGKLWHWNLFVQLVVIDCFHRKWLIFMTHIIQGYNLEDILQSSVIITIVPCMRKQPCPLHQLYPTEFDWMLTGRWQQSASWRTDVALLLKPSRPNFCQFLFRSKNLSFLKGTKLK